MDTEPIIAYRIWRLSPKHRFQLYSMANSTCWTPGEIMITDFAPDSTKYRYHGIHAWKTMGDLLDYLDFRNYNYDICIVGKVALWGKIVEHKKGYRAEFAYPYSFDVLFYSERHNKRVLDFHLNELEANLRNAYGCEVGDFKFSGKKTYEDGTVIRLQDGFLHNLNGPALEYNGAKEWWQYGVINNLNSPAYDSELQKEWWIDGKLHRDNAPAIEYKNKWNMWYKYGKLHREDGPAYDTTYFAVEWHFDGKRYDTPQIDLLPWYLQLQFILKYGHLNPLEQQVLIFKWMVNEYKKSASTRNKFNINELSKAFINLITEKLL